MDGKGGKHTVSITNANHRRCEFTIISSEVKPSPAYHIHIAIAPTKNIDRIEWFVEKAVEFGIQEVSFILCENSEQMHFKTDRAYKKVISAMKQSLKAFLPIINESVKLSDLTKSNKSNEKYIAYVDHANPDSLFDIASLLHSKIQGTVPKSVSGVRVFHCSLHRLFRLKLSSNLKLLIG